MWWWLGPILRLDQLAYPPRLTRLLTVDTALRRPTGSKTAQSIEPPSPIVARRAVFLVLASQLS